MQFFDRTYEMSPSFIIAISGPNRDRWLWNYFPLLAKHLKYNCRRLSDVVLEYMGIRF